MIFEIECKYRLEGNRTLHSELTERGAVWGPSVRQLDQYLAHPSRDFRLTDEAVRVRRHFQLDGTPLGEAFVTYKGPKIDQFTKTRREIEFPLSGRDAPSAIDLFLALGFRIAGEVDKRRTVTHLNWEGSRIEVALDEVAGLGSFVEFELQGTESELDILRGKLIGLATSLQLSAVERRSYLELLELNKSGLGLGLADKSRV